MAPPEPEPITLRSRIPRDAAGATLLDFLVRRFRYHDASAWHRELAAGRLHLDGEPAHGGEVLRPGAELRYRKQHREPAVDLDFRVLHRDDALLAVDKPAHLPMHADGPFIRNTLIARLRDREGEHLQLIHRLDRETSGVCLVATNKQVQASIQPQFADGTCRKSYLAVVHGRLEHEILCEQAIGMARDSDVRIRRSAAPSAVDARPACTQVEPVRVGVRHSLVRCRPTTGRTHQIRVHLEHAGHPVLGDKLYGHADDHYIAFVRRMKEGGSVFVPVDDGPARQLLHAHTIRIVHPTRGEPVEYEAPMPPEFEAWLQA